MRFASHFAIAILLSAQAAANDFPTTGHLYNQREDSALTYDCTLSGQVLDCEFNQTAVRRKSKPEALRERLAKAETKFPAFVEEIRSDNCRDLKDIVAVIDGADRPIADAERMKVLRSNAAQDPQSVEMLKMLVGLCEAPTLPGYMEFVSKQHEIETKTCSISSNHFKQSFEWVNGFGEDGAWVVSQSRPVGPCGVVQLSRFAKEAAESGGKYNFWRYVARKTITNPNGTAAPGMACTDLDQGEYPYGWKRKRSNVLGCQYVDFSPL